MDASKRDCEEQSSQANTANQFINESRTKETYNDNNTVIVKLI